jgi:hypothetical protein
VPSDRNVTHKEAEKKLKQKNICIEVQRVWNMKYFVIPVVTGATGTVTRGLRKYLEEITRQAFHRFIVKIKKLPSWEQLTY